MTPKEVKKKYPGYQLRSSNSKTNKYTLHLLYKQQIYHDAIGDYYKECILIINDVEKGRWDFIKKHDKPSALMWNNNDDKFIILSLDLSNKDKEDESVINDGRFTTMPYQFDINKHMMRFVGEGTADVASGRTRLDLYYPLLKKGMYVHANNSTSKIATFSYGAPNGYYHGNAGEVGLYSIKLGKIIVPTIWSYISKRDGNYLFKLTQEGNWNGFDISISNKDILNFNPETQCKFFISIFEKEV